MQHPEVSPGGFRDALAGAAADGFLRTVGSAASVLGRFAHLHVANIDNGLSAEQAKWLHTRKQELVGLFLLPAGVARLAGQAVGQTVRDATSDRINEMRTNDACGKIVFTALRADGYTLRSSTLMHSLTTPSARMRQRTGTLGKDSK